MYTLVPPSHRCFILDLALIGQRVSEEKSFEKGGRRRRTYGRRVPPYPISSPVSLQFRLPKMPFCDNFKGIFFYPRTHKTENGLCTADFHCIHGTHRSEYIMRSKRKIVRTYVIE